ncbi:acyl-CoA dehydrogenase family protein [Aureimonas sp. ME7]|uniref:acyl-CoA dehydrogenase family protein n=1 Tax=Aureimonas sp. ME7 TaxID=2744252 RepID=UPI0015F72404|nr:acyl-CoA dehydrogenase family protein [Aureimonas sp. ME7]
MSTLERGVVPFRAPARATALLAEARRLRASLAEEAGARDAERRLPYAAMAGVKAAGLHAARVPVSDGGAGATWGETAEIVLELARGDPNVAQALQPQLAITEIIRADASPEQRRRWFGRMLAGELVTNAVAERGGAFYGDIDTRLLATADGERLEGVKYYATGSLFAEHLYVTALDGTGAATSAIVPIDREGIEVEDDWNGMGQRTTASGTVRLGAVAVAPAERMPLPAGRRWHGQSSAQLVHVAIDVGIAFAALDDAILLAHSHGRTLRESGVGPAVEDPYVLQAIGDISVRAEGAAALVRQAATRVDAAADAFFADGGEDALFVAASIAVAQAKILATEAALAASEKLYLVANASGTDRSLNLDRHWRNARTHTLHDPVAYKFHFVGDHLLNGRAPPVTAKI